jgi:HPt (histidine-containing phosphotransfer) domain-containing protein
MTNEAFSKKFIFNEKIDSEYLFSLYADDFGYIEEIFATTLQHFDEDIESMKVAFEAGSVHDLKRASHKIKPTFGFVGLTSIQEQVKEFEDLCQKVPNTDYLKDDFKQILATLADCKELITSEYQKLKAFNANPV